MPTTAAETTNPSPGAMLFFRQIIDPYLAQYAYLVGCRRTNDAIIIDPERDVDRYFDIAEQEGLRIVAGADTHVHADYLSGLRELAVRHGVKVYASGENEEWRYDWLVASGLDHEWLRDGDSFAVGDVLFLARHTPGHTPEHLSYHVYDLAHNDDAMGALTGDFVFVGDVGRPDLLGSGDGDARDHRFAARSLYQSVQQFKNLPAWMQIWPGHGAGSSCGKELAAVPHSTVGYELRHNASLGASERGEDAFIEEILDGQPEPPLYFPRMKEVNRVGPPLLDGIPEMRSFEASRLDELRGRTDVALIDTRPREAFLSAHLAAALYAPFDSTFCTVVGSYVPPDLPVYLIIDASRSETAARCLARIGLDRIEGYFSPEIAGAVLSGSDGIESLTALTFGEMEEKRSGAEAIVVDVRTRAEFAEGHVPGAVNVPHTRVMDRLHELPPDQELYVHCATGVRSVVAAALLKRYGHRVLYVGDEFDSWARAHPNRIARGMGA